MGGSRCRSCSLPFDDNPQSAHPLDGEHTFFLPQVTEADDTKRPADHLKSVRLDGTFAALTVGLPVAEMHHGAVADGLSQYILLLLKFRRHGADCIVGKLRATMGLLVATPAEALKVVVTIRPAPSEWGSMVDIGRTPTAPFALAPLVLSLATTPTVPIRRVVRPIVVQRSELLMNTLGFGLQIPSLLLSVA